MAGKRVPCQCGNHFAGSLPPSRPFPTSLSVFGMAAALSAPTLLLPPHSSGMSGSGEAGNTAAFFCEWAAEGGAKAPARLLPDPPGSTHTQSWL